MKKMGLAALAAAALVACGGGGDDTPAPTPSIEGFWGDSNSAALVTSSGELWAFEDVGGGDLVLFRGSVTTSGNSFTGAITVYGSPNVPATISGTFVQRASITGTTLVAGQTGAYSMTYDPTYQLTPSLAAVAGAWSVVGGGAISISAGGVMTATRDGCALNAQITPDAGGKNYFRVTGAFGPAPCDLPGAPVTGVAVFDGTYMAAGIVSGAVGAAFAATKN